MPRYIALAPVTTVSGDRDFKVELEAGDATPEMLEKIRRRAREFVVAKGLDVRDEPVSVFLKRVAE